MSSLPASTLGSGRAYEAARLRWAVESDAERLAALWREGREADGLDGSQETAGVMRDWLEHGGVVFLEDGERRALCGVRWRWQDGGWSVDRIVTRPEARGQGYGRWLMTKLEALAIKRNVPTLTLDLDQEALLPYYQRLGYREAEGNEGNASSRRLVKQVGGTWQRQPGRQA